MKKIVTITLVLINVVFATTVFADSHEKGKGKMDYEGLGFGVGISLTIDSGGDKDRVKSASVINGIVRITDENNTPARIMLESHYFFTSKDGNFGHGPFVALQPGSNEIIEAIALGYMWGFKRDSPKGSSDSWNIGLGIVVDPNVQTLGDGIEPNEPLPTGDSLRFKEETETGLLIMSSFSCNRPVVTC